MRYEQVSVVSKGRNAVEVPSLDKVGMESGFEGKLRVGEGGFEKTAAKPETGDTFGFNVWMTDFTLNEGEKNGGRGHALVQESVGDEEEKLQKRTVEKHVQKEAFDEVDGCDKRIVKGCADEEAVSKGVRENVDNERSVQHRKVERGYSVEEGYDGEDLRDKKVLTEYVREKGCNEEDVGGDAKRVAKGHADKADKDDVTKGEPEEYGLFGERNGNGKDRNCEQGGREGARGQGRRHEGRAGGVRRSS